MSNSLCQQYLSLIYAQSVQPAERESQNIDISSTYGEVLFEGVEKLIAHLNLQSNDVFFDLGSGLGKLVSQVFLTTSVSQASGIELDHGLHRQAIETANVIQRDLPEYFGNSRQLSFLHGDFLKTSMANATSIFIASACLSMPTLDALGNMINNLKNIQSVATLKPIRTLRKLPFSTTLRLECTWDTSLCYLYK